MDLTVYAEETDKGSSLESKTNNESFPFDGEKKCAYSQDLNNTRRIKVNKLEINPTNIPVWKNIHFSYFYKNN